MDQSLMVWVGNSALELRNLQLATISKSTCSALPTSTSLFCSNSDSSQAAVLNLAPRISKKTGFSCFSSISIDDNDALVSWAESQIMKKLKDELK
jgi:hypothetical protein